MKMGLLTTQKHWGPLWGVFQFLIFCCWNFWNFLNFLKWVLCSWGRCLRAVLQTHPPENFRSCQLGAERECRMSRHGSEDPHWCERKFLFIFPMTSWKFCDINDLIAIKNTSSELDNRLEPDKKDFATQLHCLSPHTKCHNCLKDTAISNISSAVVIPPVIW